MRRLLHHPSTRLHSHLSSYSARMTSTAAATTTTSSTPSAPVESFIRSTLTAALSPTVLTIRNDSAAHAHHAAMVTSGTTSGETHFALTIVSDAFRGKPAPARHRIVYKLLEPEMKREGGIHALSLKTRTVEEEERASKEG